MTEELDKVSLLKYAYQKAGPLELVIAAAINLAIASGVYWSAESLSLVGHPALSNMVVPMCFFLPLLTTFFGILNGRNQRASGKSAPSWPKEANWTAFALRLGMLRGVVGGVLAYLVLHRLAYSLDNPSMSKWAGVALIGVLAGILGYWLHSSAILLTIKRFPPEPEVPHTIVPSKGESA